MPRARPANVYPLVRRVRATDRCCSCPQREGSGGGGFFKLTDGGGESPSCGSAMARWSQLQLRLFSFGRRACEHW